MGTFRIEIEAVGGHGVDREVKDGEIVNFYKDGRTTPDAVAKSFAEALKWVAGADVRSAKIIHWPGDKSEVTDDLMTGERRGNF